MSFEMLVTEFQWHVLHSVLLTHYAIMSVLKDFVNMGVAEK
jgi:hypothetical protein